MSDSVGKIQLDLETNATPFQQQLNGIAGKSTNMVTAAFGKLAKVAAGAFAVKKLIDFGKASVNLASDLQEVQNVVDVVFGESASQINNFAKSAITSYGLSELSAKRYSSTVGAMLKSMGLSGDAVLNMSQSITALTGDMASFYNLDSDTAFQKIRAGISGETEPLKQLGINMSQANLEAFALSQGITKSMQSMTQSEQALLRYNYLLSVTSDAQGDFARTSDSWANQTRILSEQMNSLKATMGSAFLAMLTPVVRLLNAFISKLQIAAAYFKAFVETLTGTKAESESTASGFEGITEGVEETTEAATKAKKALAGFDKLNVLSSDTGDSGDASGSGIFDVADFQGATVTVPEPDTSGVEAFIDKMKQVFGGLATHVSPAVEQVRQSASSLWKNTLAPFGQYLMQDWVPGIVGIFTETLAPMFTDIMSARVTWFAETFAFCCDNIKNVINDILLPAFESVKTISTDAAQAVADEWDKSGTKLIKMFGKVRDSIKSIWTNLYEAVLKPVWQSIIQGIDSLWEKHLKGLWESIVAFVSKLAECIMSIWNNFLSPLIQWLIDVFGPSFVAIFQGVWEIVRTVVGNLVDAVKNIFTALGGLMDFITGVFTGDWKKAWEGIKTFFSNIWEAIANVLKAYVNIIIGVINTLLNAITTAINTAIRALNSLSFTVPDWVPGIGGKQWGFNIKQMTAPKIPYLAKGGIIDQPTLAMVGEAGKEAVVPLENTAFADSIANAIMRVLMPLFANGKGVGKNSDDTPSVIVLKVGEYELGRVTVGSINKYHHMIGRVELEV